MHGNGWQNEEENTTPTTLMKTQKLFIKCYYKENIALLKSERYENNEEKKN